MIDKRKMAISLGCEVGMLVVYMVQHDIIRASDAMHITVLITKTFIRVINAYIAMELGEGEK